MWFIAFIQFNRLQNGQFFYNVACVTWQAKLNSDKVRCLFIFYLKITKSNKKQHKKVDSHYKKLYNIIINKKEN